MNSLIKDKNEFLIKKNYKEYLNHLELIKKVVSHKDLLELNKNLKNHRENLMMQIKNNQEDPNSNDFFELNKKLYKDSRDLYKKNIHIIRNNIFSKKTEDFMSEIEFSENIVINIKNKKKSPFLNFVKNITKNNLNLNISKYKALLILPIVAGVFLANQTSINSPNQSINDFTPSFVNQEIIKESINNSSSNSQELLEKIRESDSQEIKISISPKETYIISTPQIENKETVITEKELFNPENSRLEEGQASLVKEVTQRNYSLGELKRISSENSSLAKEYSAEEKLTIEDLNKIGRSYGLPDRLLYAVYMKESQGNNNLVSNKNAVGPFQFLKATARDFGIVYKDESGKEVDLRRNSFYSADASARYIRWLFEITNPKADSNNPESFKYAIAAYNAGIGRVKTNKGVRIPNFKETLDYVDKIIGFASGEKYIVEKGDTLEEISQKTGIEASKISTANNGIRSNQLIAGSFINSGGYLALNSEDNTHRVSVGDTLFKLSQKYNVPVEDIMEYNNLDDHVIKSGQKLIIASNDITGKTYKIR